jgi:hypothetical protein
MSALPPESDIKCVIWDVRLEARRSTEWSARPVPLTPDPRRPEDSMGILVWYVGLGRHAIKKRDL